MKNEGQQANISLIRSGGYTLTTNNCNIHSKSRHELTLTTTTSAREKVGDIRRIRIFWRENLETNGLSSRHMTEIVCIFWM